MAPAGPAAIPWRTAPLIDLEFAVPVFAMPVMLCARACLLLSRSTPGLMIVLMSSDGVFMAQ